MFERTRMVAVAFVATAAFGVTSGCANGAAGGAAASVDLATARTTYDSVVGAVYGTAQQRAVGAERGWLLMQVALAECMRKAGAEYPVAPYPAGIDAVGPPSPGDLMAFAPLRDDFGVGKRKRAKAAGGEPRNRAFERLKPRHGRKAYLDKLQGCQPATQGYEDAHAPAGRDELIDKLTMTLTRVQYSEAVAPLLEDYGPCVGRHGVQVKDMTELYLSITRAYPVAASANADITKDPRWASALAYEAKAAKADKACRTEAVDAALIAAAPALTRFTAANRRELIANQDAYAAFEREVMTLRSTAQQY